MPHRIEIATAKLCPHESKKIGFARHYPVTGRSMICLIIAPFFTTINPISPTTWLQWAIASQRSACNMVVGRGGMISERQLDANRRNAARSHGRITPEGRAAVRLNALKHGFTTAEIILPTVEDLVARDQLALIVLDDARDHDAPTHSPKHRLGGLSVASPGVVK
jgi:hypothetical protein